MDKRNSRARRARKSRAKMRELGVYRLAVYKSNKHLYAQIIRSEVYGDKVLASASTNQNGCEDKKNIAGSSSIGKSIAEQAKKIGIEKVAFDRSGYQFYGRVKQIADSAREAGLQI